jgi:V/A-type H+-transporting ATPase subunit K
MASHAAMTRTEEGHGKFIALSAVASSQAIYGIIESILMRNAIVAGTLSAWGGIGIGFFVGMAFLFSAMYQGDCAATAIQASAKQPALFGKTVAALGIVESFALFPFVFSVLLFK